MEIKYYVENPELIINSEHLELNKLNDFDFNVIKNLSNVKAKRGEKKHGKVYVDAIGAHDLESTRLKGEKLNSPYIFQTTIYAGDICYFIGIRKDWTLQKFFDKIADALGHQDGVPRTLVIFDFNWHYEYMFEHSIFKYFDIFFKDIEHPLYGYSHGGHIEWRDAQALFGPGGLAGATKGVEHEKLDGDLDYSKKLFYWSKIDAKPEYDDDGRRHSEFDYMVNDTVGMVEAVEREMKVNNCSLYGLKHTFTGWCRKDISRILYPMRQYHAPITDHDTFHVYQGLMSAKRGGNTHANKEYVGDIYDFTCFDISSSYPAIMQFSKFPIAPFRKINWPDKATVEGELERGENAMLIKIKCYNLELKDEFEPVPYVSKDKCEKIVGLGQLNKWTRKGSVVYKQAQVVGEEDNGRISYCCYYEAWITDVDLRIMKDMYNFDYDVDELYVSKYEYLPDDIREYIKELYILKTAYKDRGPEFENEYRKCKVRINAIFGLFLTSLLRDTVEYDENSKDYKTTIFTDKPSYMQELDYADACKRTMLVPRIGVWVCAHAREKLQKFINIVGIDFLYCDTDSVFYLHHNKYKEAIEKLNEEWKQQAIDFGSYADDVNGVTHYCGTFELDKEGKFVSMGCKKYAYEKNGKIILTVAGVPKSEGSKELAKAGGLKAFKPGLVFHAGKLRPIYNNEKSYGTHHVVDEYGVEGDVEVKSNVCLVDVNYELGYGKTYGNLVDAVKRGDMSILHEMLDNTDRDALTAEVLRRRYHLEN